MTTNENVKPGDLIRSYRDRIAKDPDLYDGDIDIVLWLIEDTSSFRDWTPSQIGSFARIKTSEVQNILRTLVADGYVVSDNRGAWSHYWSARRR
jgi:hypothetical protein